MKNLAVVFGGSGFLGTQVVRALVRDGWRVRVAVRNTGAAYRLPMQGEVGQVGIVQANVRDRPSIDRALEGASACVNAVGVLYESGRQRFEALHADGAGAVAAAAAQAGAAHFVHLSAIGADAASPSAYQRSKAAGEAAVRAAFPGATVLRPSVVFGTADSFFNRFAAMAAVSPALPLIGGGTTRFQPVHVADVAAAVAAALARPDAAGRTFELGGPAIYTFRELMEILLAEIRRKRALIPIPFGMARLLGVAGDLVAATGLIAPPITSDQVTMLRADNVVADGAAGLAELGIAARALEPVLPTYLWRYRKGGQYADLEQPAPAPAG